MKTNTETIKIILADDHVLLRDALASLINSFGEFEVIAMACNGKEVLQHLDNGIMPRLIILDQNMPELNGHDTAKIISEKYPDVNVLILTMFDSELLLIRLLQVGIKGFLKKDIHPFELKKALLQVADDHYYYSFTSLDKLTHLVKKSEAIDDKKNKMLSDTEIQFLRLSSSDMTYKEIANLMKMTPRKVDHLRDHMFEKLEIKSRVGLAIYAVRNGLISFP